MFESIALKLKNEPTLISDTRQLSNNINVCKSTDEHGRIALSPVTQMAVGRGPSFISLTEHLPLLMPLLLQSELWNDMYK